MPALKTSNPHRNAPEYADRVNLLKKIKIGKEWRFAPVIAESNGRLKDKVRVNGQVEVRAIRAGLIAAPEPPPAAPDKTPIDEAIKDYLRYVKMQRKKRTHLTYR